MMRVISLPGTDWKLMIPRREPVAHWLQIELFPAIALIREFGEWRVEFGWLLWTAVLSRSSDWC